MSVEAIIEAPGARELVRARKSRSPGERGDFAAYFADLLQRPRQIAVDKEKPLPPEERANLQGMAGCRGEKEATRLASQEQRPSFSDPGNNQVEGTARQDLSGGMSCGAKGGRQAGAAGRDGPLEGQQQRDKTPAGPVAVTKPTGRGEEAAKQQEGPVSSTAKDAGQKVVPAGLAGILQGNQVPEGGGGAPKPALHISRSGPAGSAPDREIAGPEVTTKSMPLQNGAAPNRNIAGRETAAGTSASLNAGSNPPGGPAGEVNQPDRTTAGVVVAAGSRRGVEGSPLAQDPSAAGVNGRPGKGAGDPGGAAALLTTGRQYFFRQTASWPGADSRREALPAVANPGREGGGTSGDKGITAGALAGQVHFSTQFPGTAFPPGEGGAVLHNLQGVVAAILAAARMSGSGARRELEIQLQPESLGYLKLKASLEGGRLVLHLLVENQEAARALQLAVPEMRQAVAGQGLRLEQVQVQVGSGGQSHDYPAGDRGEYRQGSPEWQRGALPGNGHQGRETSYGTWYRLDYLA